MWSRNNAVRMAVPVTYSVPVTGLTASEMSAPWCSLTQRRAPVAAL
jgi:hypothetical protein